MKKPYVWLVIAVLTAIMAVCCVLEPTLIVLIAVGAYGVYKLFEYNKNQEQIQLTQMQINQETAVKAVYTVALKVLSKLSNSLEIDTPRTFTDIYSNDYIIKKQGLTFIRTRVRLRATHKQDMSLYPAYLRLIQTEVNRGLSCGDFDDVISMRTVYNNQPIIIAENIAYYDCYLVIDWCVLDSHEKYNYLCNSKNVINISMPSKEDEDF